MAHSFNNFLRISKKSQATNFPSVLFDDILRVTSRLYAIGKVKDVLPEIVNSSRSSQVYIKKHRNVKITVDGLQSFGI